MNVTGLVQNQSATSAGTVTRPSLNLLSLVVVFSVGTAGYFALIWAGQLRGYEPSTLVAIRDMAFAIPVIAVFLWFIRRQKFKGEMLLFSTAVFLFMIGLLTQYRLFNDPEYGARGTGKGKAREAKAQTIRLLNLQTGYDDAKKRFMFGSPENVPDAPEEPTVTQSSVTIGRIVSSPNTYIPLIALLGLAASFTLFQQDKFLLWLQRHSMLIGLGTLIPFSIIVLLFSEEGKFFGQTTPWEAVKIPFLASFAGILADNYGNLRRTRWGLPQARYIAPLVVIAAMPVVPFFALSDFGQMLVFLGVYVILYVIAVRKKIQLLYGLILVVVVFGVFYVASTASTGFGIPGRAHFRFYQWKNTWQPPPVDTWWWKRDFERYLKATRSNPDPNDSEKMRRLNQDAWSDRVLQQSQGLFGIHEGGVVGEGLGLGFPETVPVSDSDFVYAALAEETGLAGSTALLLGLGLLVFVGITVSLRSSDMFTKLIAAGFSAFIGLQAIVNMGGVLRLMPMTGITLPFVSHGGWSLITSFAMLGILMAISHRNHKPPPTMEPRPQFVPVR